jgi:hypothetical protein
LGVRGEAALEVSGHLRTLSVSLDLSSVDDPGADTESPVAALLEDLDRYRFVLTDGRFVAAVGFDIHDENAAATLQEIPEAALEDGGELQAKLSWRVAGQ